MGASGAAEEWDADIPIASAPLLLEDRNHTGFGQRFDSAIGGAYTPTQC